MKEIKKIYGTGAVKLLLLKLQYYNIPYNPRTCLNLLIYFFFIEWVIVLFFCFSCRLYVIQFRPAVILSTHLLVGDRSGAVCAVNSFSSPSK